MLSYSSLITRYSSTDELPTIRSKLGAGASKPIVASETESTPRAIGDGLPIIRTECGRHINE